MGALTFSWSDNLTPNIEKMRQKCDMAVLMYAKTKADQLQNYMQKNRKWTDRTGLAAKSLRGFVSVPKEHQVRITLAHGVEYGIWLELAHEMNYAIVRPTILTKSGEVLDGLDMLMSKIFASFA